MKNKTFFIFLVSIFMFSNTYFINASTTIKTNKNIYVENEPILVKFSGMKGKEQDWVTITKKNSPKDIYGEWFYTRGIKSGSFKFNGLTQGEYEARAYFDWPEGQYIIQASYSFKVIKKANSKIKTTYSVYHPSEKIILEYFNMPGNKQDWIAIAKKSDPPQNYIQYFYTNRQKKGIFTFNGLEKGIYEIRVFLNWPEGRYKVVDHLTIKVVPYTKKEPIIKNIKINKKNIIVNLSNMYGADKDWVTIVKKDSPKEEYGEYFYTNGKRKGSYTFKKLPPGKYEVRVFFNWPEGRYKIQDSKEFVIK